MADERAPRTNEPSLNLEAVRASLDEAARVLAELEPRDRDTDAA
jgi:hypothetical protein